MKVYSSFFNRYKVGMLIVGINIILACRLGKIKVEGPCLLLKRERPHNLLNVVELCVLCAHTP